MSYRILLTTLHSPMLHCPQGRIAGCVLRRCVTALFLLASLTRQFFGELTLSHHAPTGASAFVYDPLAVGGGFHLRYESADRVILSDEPQLLAVNLVCSNGLPALKGHYHVEMLPQPNLLLEEHAAASGRQILCTSGAIYLHSGNLLGVAHAPVMRAPIAVFQSTNSAPAVSPSTNAPEIAASLENPLSQQVQPRPRPRLPCLGV